MQYYLMDIGAPKAGETVQVDVRYAKDTDALSVESLQVQPTGPINGNDGSDNSGFLRYLPWVIGGVGVLLIAGGLIWYWLMSKTVNQPVATKRGRRSTRPIKSPEQLSAENGSKGAFCHQCGKRAAAGDRFCRSCGTKLRS
jgi:hypothetical protein